MPLTADVVTVAEDIAGALEAAWDDLAVAGGRPFCAPGWLLGWWAQAAPPAAELRLLVVREGPEVVGIAPCFALGGRLGGERWRFLGYDVTQRVEPLARAGFERGVAAALATAMARHAPAWVAFDGVPADSPWPAALVEAWPGPRTPSTCTRRTILALTIDLAGRDFESWFMSKTSHFRQRLRKGRKQLAARGGGTRLGTPETIEGDLTTFVRLHHARWEHLEGESSLTPPIGRMLQDAARALPVPGRLQVSTMEAGGEALASSVVLVAGDEIGYWSNGFDARHQAISPARLTILWVIEAAFASGARRLDLGAGDYEYKRRFADGEEPLLWLWLVPPGPRHGLVRLYVAAEHRGRDAADRLPPKWRERLRTLLRR